MTNRRIVLRSRPEGEPTEDNFEMTATSVPGVTDGQVLRRTIYLSLDPYMRGRMSDAPSYSPHVELGQVMVGHTVSQVIESKNRAFARGDFVAGYDGWQDYGLSNGNDLRKIDPSHAPLSTSLGVLGMPGMTAYVGLLDIGQPKPGETVAVSAASGAVGAVVGQIAKIKGCRAVGIAGSEEKCDYVVQELGFDACVNHRSSAFPAELADACSNGIDVYFENVGGDVLAAVLPILNLEARIPLCGVISEYTTPKPLRGTSLRPFLVKRAMLKGFIILDHQHRSAAFLEDCGRWLQEGRLKWREDIVNGLEQAPSALPRLYEGRNFGKLIVRVSPDPTQNARS
jgi:NADPH-dependent curcumin reductase CurA